MVTYWIMLWMIYYKKSLVLKIIDVQCLNYFKTASS